MTSRSSSVPAARPTAADGPDPAVGLLDLTSAFMASRVILTAVELGLFEPLATGCVSGTEVALALGTDRDATEILLNALAALGTVRRCHDGFELPEDLAPCLDPAAPDGLGDVLRHMGRLWSSWSGLTQAVRDGHPRPRSDAEGASLDLARAMRWYARESAPRVAALLEDTRPGRILDLGGGAGSFSIALARQLPEARVELCDRDPQALGVARADIEAAGLTQRIRVREVDALTGDIGSGYDLVLLSSVLCTCPDEQCHALLTAARDALVPGGRIAIRDLMLDSSTTSSLPAALFSLTMLLTGGGRVRWRGELKRRLEGLGFADVHWLPMDPMHVMIGVKAGP